MAYKAPTVVQKGFNSIEKQRKVMMNLGSSTDDGKEEKPAVNISIQEEPEKKDVPAEQVSVEGPSQKTNGKAPASKKQLCKRRLSITIDEDIDDFFTMLSEKTRNRKKSTLINDALAEYMLKSPDYAPEDK